MIEDNWKELALQKAQKFCDTHGVCLSTLGAKIVGDGDFFVDLKDNPEKSCNCKTLLKVKRFFQSNQSNKPKRKR